MIRREAYNEKVDIWSFAMCMLELANGEPPFMKQGGLKAMFTAATVGYPQPFKHPEKWSADCKNFLASCLTLDPAKRASADHLLLHPFLEKATTRKSMKDILSGIFLHNELVSYGL